MRREGYVAHVTRQRAMHRAFSCRNPRERDHLEDLAYKGWWY